MLKLRGFRASLNFYGKNSGLEDEENFTVDEDIVMTGAYRVKTGEFFEYNNELAPPKKITPSMVRLPPSQSQPEPKQRLTKSSSDLTQIQNDNNIPIELRKSTPQISEHPRGESSRENPAPQKKQKEKKVKKTSEKPNKLSKEELKQQKLNEKALKQQQKIEAQELKKQEKLRLEREKLELKERQKAEKEQARLAKEQEKQLKNSKKKVKAPKPPKNASNAPPPPPMPDQPPPLPLSQPPSAMKRANPLAQASSLYSSNTLESSTSKTSGPPPYEVTPNDTDDTGNTSFGKPVEEDSSWDLVSRHRQQVRNPVIKERRPKRTVMDLQYNVGNLGGTDEQSDT